MLFCARQLQELCREKTFLYLQSSSISRKHLTLSTAPRFGLCYIDWDVHPGFISIARQMHDGMAGRILTTGSLSHELEIATGLKKSCVLAPLLFKLFCAAEIRQATQSSSTTVYVRSRTDGKLINY